MSVNLVMLVKDRPRLTEQAVRTLYENTPQGQFNLTIMDDGSYIQTRGILADWAIRHSNMRAISLSASIGIVGFLRNVGAAASERHFGRGDYLCFVDNDVAFLSNWLEKMVCAKETIQWAPEGREDGKGYSILGGYRHPYHGVNYVSFKEGEFPGALNLRVEETDAVAGYSMFMSWATWDRFGPFPDNQKGIGASEDYALCRRVVEGHGHVGYVHPPCLVHCGITNSNGQPATGADQFWRVPGLLYE